MSVAPASLTRHAGPSRDRGPPCSSQPNVWRDINLTDRLAVYSGGGIGGGGAINRLSDRVEFDVSYRFFATEQADTAIFLTPVSGPPPVPTGSSAQHTFSASEMLFTLRVYEPFRGWRR